MSKLIVIRGNSGCGKTSAAHALRSAILDRGYAESVAVVEQDFFRRIVLKQKETAGGDAVELIRRVAGFGIERGYDVILEGILGATTYGAMIGGLMASAEGYAFYFDVPFEETLRRHATKPKAAEFGEAEMRGWWKEHDVLGVEGETIVPETVSLADAVELILGKAYARP